MDLYICFTNLFLSDKIKNGEKVVELASQYGISPKTIYGWLRNQVNPQVSIAQLNRLKRENEELKRIIGLITLELERGKKSPLSTRQTIKK